MIRSLFMPTSLNGYYYIEQRIVALEINKLHVYAVVIKAHGKKRIVEHYLKQPILQDETVDEREATKQALQALFDSIKKYDSVTLVLPNNQLFFKEVTVPFTDEEKIKLVIPFEVESLLPFGLSEATLDSIPIQKNQTSTTMLVAALKNDVLEHYKTMFDELGIPLTRITVSALELFSFYKTLPIASMHEPIALISLDFNSMTIMVIVGNELKFIRVLNNGIYRLAKNLETKLKIKFSDIVNGLATVGIPTEDEVSEKVIQSFFEELVFSLQVALTKLQLNSFKKIIITGFGSDVKGLDKILEKMCHAPVEPLQAHTAVHEGLVKITATIPHAAIACLATGLVTPTTLSFNLLNTVSKKEERVIGYQLITACILFLVGIGTFGLYSFFTIQSLNTEAHESEREAIAKLKREFDLGKIKEKSLEDVNIRARQELVKEENIWFALQNKSFLYYLQELSTRIDRAGLGLTLKKLVLNEKSVIIEGSVKDFDALKTFEDDLQQSNLFVSIPKLHDIKFAVELTLEKKL